MTALATTLGLAAYAVLPHLVETHLREKLAASGFPHARLEVASVGMRHLDLRNIHLVDGFDIRSLHVDRGLSLLWSRPDTISIGGANVTTSALAETSRTLKSSGHGPLPFRRAQIIDSTVTAGSTRTDVTASATRTGSVLDVSITLTDPSPSGWTASARGQVTLGSAVSLERGHVDVTVPTRRAGRVAITNAELSADISGDLSHGRLSGSGLLEGQRVEVGAYALTEARVPFTLDADGLHVWGAKATTTGGELALDPFVVSARPFDVVLHARGLELANLLAPTSRATGRGRIDGQLALHVGDGGWAVTSGELHARERGALQISDAAWRDKVSHAESPFAVHAQVANALTDFEFSDLSARLAPAGDNDQELRLIARGRGRRNHQELDLAVAVHGLRSLTRHLPGAAP